LAHGFTRRRQGCWNGGSHLARCRGKEAVLDHGIHIRLGHSQAGSGYNDLFDGLLPVEHDEHRALSSRK